MRIYKYAIGRVPFITRTLTIPARCHRLFWGLQGDILCLWAMVTPDRESPTRTITLEMYATGEEVQDAAELQYVTTFQDGAYVGHVFERFERHPSGDRLTRDAS